MSDEKVMDVRGVEIIIGSHIVYATRGGSSLWMNAAVITQIERKQCYYGEQIILRAVKRNGSKVRLTSLGTIVVVEPLWPCPCEVSHG